jgi:taurine dioxygenase
MLATLDVLMPRRNASMPENQRTQSITTDLDVRPLAGRIGAQIENLRLAGDLPHAAVAAIEAALSKHKVIFFRNQGHLDDAEQERFAARLGVLIAHPTTPTRAGSAAILELDSTDGRGAPTVGTPT